MFRGHELDWQTISKLKTWYFTCASCCSMTRKVFCRDLHWLSWWKLRQYVISRYFRVWIYKGYRTIRWCSCGVGKGKAFNVEMVYTQHSEVAQSYLKIAGSLIFPEECRKVKLQRVTLEWELERKVLQKDVHPAKWLSQYNAGIFGREVASDP